MPKQPDKKYRPSSGSEGEWFMNRWCCHCKRDQKFMSGKSDKGCRILAATFAYFVDDPKYPKQWIRNKDGNPICTAFRPIGEATKKRNPKPKPIPLFDNAKTTR